MIKSFKDKETQNIFDGIPSQKYGNILVTCWDGNVHLFKPPNVDDLAF